MKIILCRVAGNHFENEQYSFIQIGWMDFRLFAITLKYSLRFNL